jgi:ABC-2 type transport system permease protein
VKAPFTPFAGGKTIARKTEGEYNVLETRIDVPVSYVAVIAGKYHYEEEKRGNVTVRTASYGMKNTRAIKKLNALAYDMIAYYEFFLGPFPFDELNIVEIDDFGWGQAPAGLIFITQEAFQPLLGTLNQLYSEGINERIAHEIAHQYWHHVVKMPSYDEQWLSESFAEYSAALLLKKFQGDAIYNRLVAHWKGNAKVAAGTAPIPFANRIRTPNNADWQRVHLLYSKGPLLLAALHKEVGDEAFLTFMKSYQKSFRFKYGTTKDVAGLLGVIAKKDFKPFMERYYWGLETPQ